MGHYPKGTYMLPMPVGNTIWSGRWHFLTFMPNCMTVVIALGNNVNSTTIIQNSGMFNSPTKFSIDHA